MKCPRCGKKMKPAESYIEWIKKYYCSAKRDHHAHLSVYVAEDKK